MSVGQLNHLLTERHDLFHQEKAEIKTAGLAVSRYFQADDTGVRHQGHNGYCTYLGNEWCAWFASTDSKSRVNFLQLLQTDRRYELNAEALAYMAERGVAARSTVDLQLGPGRAVHQHGVHGPPGAGGHPDQHGWSGTDP